MMMKVYFYLRKSVYYRKRFLLLKQELYHELNDERFIDSLDKFKVILCLISKHLIINVSNNKTLSVPYSVCRTIIVLKDYIKLFKSSR